MASRSASFDRRTRSDDSWVEISSQPSSSSLSSINDEIQTAGLRVQHDTRAKRRRTIRPGAPSHLHISHPPLSAGSTSSQEEYEESESESDRVMTSSGEGPHIRGLSLPASFSPASAPQTDDDDDENRTAINCPVNNDTCFTPQPNAFSHPPTSEQMRHASAPVPGSYFPAQRQSLRPTPRQPAFAQQERQSHLPQNILSPSYNAAAQHDEALRASLSTLLSCAAAARGLSKADTKQPQTATTATQVRSNRVEPISFRLVPESAVPVASPPFQEPTFQPTIRRTSTSTSASSEQLKEHKRKAGAGGRSSSRERRALKKARRSASSEDLYITPTLLTWVVSAGVVVFLSALSFSAGYSLGKEAGRVETGGFAGDEQIRSCAREASRTSLGLKRSLARSAVQV
ncbi:hypothetical protein BAUCODRAFT_150904 [Baudoinia panamericana UAMH 10762]|uniref:REJ domain-containing protein n=1 Tax=Baudoinia panamericana (strain UAMH 10762) TaxID=717646 RepID=M2MAV9_BAUPA|nr:uncharacterized protein BAUCODRAFT_150904 [Baudoinia panamericana UAMH 10762]EMC93606.1 hypothetical protein BAUCODRAFT_150904 [Baudoinia panamericana UAMH 10762]